VPDLVNDGSAVRIRLVLSQFDGRDAEKDAAVGRGGHRDREVLRGRKPRIERHPRIGPGDRDRMARNLHVARVPEVDGDQEGKREVHGGRPYRSP
jgi:hypothetical protein